MQKNNNNNPLYSWTFDDRKNRWYMWYIIALSVVIWLTIWGFLTRQYGMSFLFILIAWVTYFVENSSEDDIIVTVTDLWINVSNVFYDFSRINSYCFIYENDNAVYLKLMLKRKWLWLINLKIDNDVVSNLKQILPDFLEEDGKQDLTFTEKLINFLKL